MSIDAPDPDRLTLEDVRILGLETATVAGHTLKVTVLDDAAPPLGLDELRAQVSVRLAGLPRLAARLEPLADGGLAWAPDPSFALERHVRARDGASELTSAVARLMEERLDREHPLWTLDLLDGRAIALKVHHAMADGIAARHIATALLWDVTAGEGGRAPAPPEPRVRHGLADVPRLSAVIERELAPSVERSALARRVHTDRAVAFADASLQRLRGLREVHGLHVTVNDVVLAAVAGGLRRWLLEREEPLRRMRVKVPVSLHRPDEAAGTLGNDDSFFFVDLPLAQPDPVTRLATICLDCTQRKHHADALELGTLLHSAAALSPTVGRGVVRWSMSPHVFTLNVSNVPGPRGALTVAGRPVRAVYALAEVADWHALRVAVFSAAGQVTFGLCADGDEVPGLQTIARGIEEELELLAAALV